MAERIIKHLPVELTDAESNEWARRAAVLAGEEDERAANVEASKERAKSIVKEAESALAGKRAERSQAARIARERREYRDVDCEERISRFDRRCIVTRLDTLEIVSSRPVSDDEMRRGARWKPNFVTGRSELRHEEEPDVLLDVRALSDSEKQVPLPGPAGEVKATSLAEAAAIAAAREKGDLPPAEGELYEPKGPATSITSEELDKLTGVAAKPESRVPDMHSLGIEQRAAESGPTGTVTVFYVSAERAEAIKANDHLFAMPWALSLDGATYESAPLLAHDASDTRRVAEAAGLSLGERTLTGPLSTERFEVLAPRAAFDALDFTDEDRLRDVRTGDDTPVKGRFMLLDGSETARWDHALSAEHAASVVELAKRLGLETTMVADVMLPCAACGCLTTSQRLMGAVLCTLKKCCDARESGATPTPEKTSKKSKKKAERSPEEISKLVAARTSELNATKNAHALGAVWRSVCEAKLPVEACADLVLAFRAKAERMGLSETTLADMRARGEAPALATSTQPSASA